jgi:hypothetical protein
LLFGMSDEHVGRTKTSATWGFRSKRFWVASWLMVAVATPAAGYVFYPWGSNDIAEIVRQAGFDPLVPPNRLRGPGSLYVVDGSSYQLVCEANEAMLDGKVQKSPTENQFRRKLERGAFALGADLVDAVNAKLGASRLTSIEYSLTDVGISEIAYSDLWQIQDALLKDPACGGVVHRFLKASKKVCPGYSALSATTLYRVNTDAKLETEAKAVVSAAQMELREDSRGEVEVRSNNELSGDDLFYGIRLSQFCISVLAPSPTVVDPAAAAVEGVVMETETPATEDS